MFYDDDVDFLRHHKRTKRNMEYILKKYLIESGKQAIDSGIKENFRIMITHTMLNKAWSLLHVWWDMIVFDNDIERSGIQFEIVLRFRLFNHSKLNYSKFTYWKWSTSG